MGAPTWGPNPLGVNQELTTTEKKKRGRKGRNLAIEDRGRKNFFSTFRTSEWTRTQRIFFSSSHRILSLYFWLNMTNVNSTSVFRHMAKISFGIGRLLLGKIFIIPQLLWTWFINPKRPLSPPRKVAVQIEIIHKPEPGDPAKPRAQWPIPEPRHIFRFRKQINRMKPIPGIISPGDYGRINKERFHIDVDLVVNYQCDYYIRNGELVDTTQSRGYFMVLNTNNGIMSNRHVLHALKHEAFRRTISSNWMHQLNVPSKSIRVCRFDILFRNTWDDDIWSQADLNNPLNNFCMAIWNTGRFRPITEIWISMTLQSQHIPTYSGMPKMGINSYRPNLWLSQALWHEDTSVFVPFMTDIPQRQWRRFQYPGFNPPAITEPKLFFSNLTLSATNPHHAASAHAPSFGLKYISPPYDYMWFTTFSRIKGRVHIWYVPRRLDLVTLQPWRQHFAFHP